MCRCLDDGSQQQARIERQTKPGALSDDTRETVRRATCGFVCMPRFANRKRIEDDYAFPRV
jgi:hypothetical protein